MTMTKQDRRRVYLVHTEAGGRRVLLAGDHRQANWVACHSLSSFYLIIIILGVDNDDDDDDDDDDAEQVREVRSASSAQQASTLAISHGNHLYLVSN